MFEKNWHKIAFVFLVGLALALKWNFWGDLNFASLHWWNAQVLNYASAWFDEGFFYLKAALYDQAASVEFAQKGSRVVNSQVTSFFVIPVFFLSKLIFTSPGVWLLNVLSFILHLLFSLLIGLVTFEILKDFKETYRKISFVSASLSALFLASLFNLFTVTYWADHLCVVLLLLALWIEFRSVPLKQKKIWDIVQAAALVLAALAEHYGFIFILVFLMYSLLKKEASKIKILKYSLGASVFLFLVLYHYSNSIVTLFDSAFFGIGYSSFKGTALTEIFSKIFLSHLGFYALAVLGAFGVAEYLHRKHVISVKALVLFFLPPIVYTLIFANRSFFVIFTVFKFYVPICIFIFGALPAVLLSFAHTLKNKQKPLKILALLSVFLLCLSPFLSLAFNYSKFLSDNEVKNEEYEILSWIKSITHSEEIIITNFYKLNYYPPQGNFMIRKPVWQFGSFKGFDGWRKIFADTQDYPLLWLEKPTERSAECKELYASLQAQKVSEFKGIEAFLFPKLRNFVDLTLSNEGKCL